jgi:stage V sporulation protein B
MLTKLMVREEYGRAREKIGQAMRFTMIVAIPSAVGLAVLARPIVTMLFKGEVDMAVNMLQIGSVSVIFYTMSTLTNGVLQGINRMQVPVRNAAISLVMLCFCMRRFSWEWESMRSCMHIRCLRLSYVS